MTPLSTDFLLFFEGGGGGGGGVGGRGLLMISYHYCRWLNSTIIHRELVLQEGLISGGMLTLHKGMSVHAQDSPVNIPVQSTVYYINPCPAEHG